MPAKASIKTLREAKAHWDKTFAEVNDNYRERAMILIEDCYQGKPLPLSQLQLSRHVRKQFGIAQAANVLGRPWKRLTPDPLDIAIILCVSANSLLHKQDENSYYGFGAINIGTLDKVGAKPKATAYTPRVQGSQQDRVNGSPITVEDNKVRARTIAESLGGTPQARQKGKNFVTSYLKKIPPLKRLGSVSFNHLPTDSPKKRSPAKKPSPLRSVTVSDNPITIENDRGDNDTDMEVDNDDSGDYGTDMDVHDDGYQNTEALVYQPPAHYNDGMSTQHQALKLGKSTSTMPTSDQRHVSRFKVQNLKNLKRNPKSEIIAYRQRNPPPQSDSLERRDDQVDEMLQYLDKRQDHDYTEVLRLFNAIIDGVVDISEDGHSVEDKMRKMGPVGAIKERERMSNHGVVNVTRDIGGYSSGDKRKKIGPVGAIKGKERMSNHGVVDVTKDIGGYSSGDKRKKMGPVGAIEGRESMSKLYVDLPQSRKHHIDKDGEELPMKNRRTQ